MYPAQGDLLGEQLELRRIVTDPCFNHGDRALFPASRDGAGLLNACPLLRARLEGIQQGIKSAFVKPGAFFQPFIHGLAYFIGQLKALEQADGLLIIKELSRREVPEHIQHRQAIFVHGGEIGRVKGITENLRVMVFAINPSAGVIGLLIRRTGQSRLNKSDFS